MLDWSAKRFSWATIAVAISANVGCSPGGSETSRRDGGLHSDARATDDAPSDGNGAGTTFAFCRGCALDGGTLGDGPRPRVGAWYFDGWAAVNDTTPDNLWLEPHFSSLLQREWSGREPLTGWYDADPLVLEKFCQWAHAAGIDFWLFDWYYTETAPPIATRLNTSLANFVASKKRSGMKFAIAYIANFFPIATATQWDNWTAYWAKYFFQDPDYLTVAGRPVVFVYSAPSLNDALQSVGGAPWALQQLRANVTHANPPLPEPYIIATALPGPANNWDDLTLYLKQGYDGFTEYNYPGGPGTNVGTPDAPAQNPFSVIADTAHLIWQTFANYPGAPRYIPDVTAGWDTRAWPGEKVPFYYDRDPVSVGQLVLDAEQWARQHPEQQLSDSPMILIEAWNEMGEGAYLVPTIGDQAKYLEELAKVIPQ